MQLPLDFRPADVLAFHARDPQQRAERVDGDGFAKGFMWHGHPACLTVAFRPGEAEVTLAVDGPAASGAISFTLESSWTHCMPCSTPGPPGRPAEACHGRRRAFWS